MGWIRALFSGHNPEATREVMRLAFRQNLRRFDNQAPPARRWEAAAMTIYNRRTVLGPKMNINSARLEAIPFAGLDDLNCEDALAEYAVALEHPGQGDKSLIARSIKAGLRNFVSTGRTETAEYILGLYVFLLGGNLDTVPWTAFLDAADVDVVLEAVEPLKAKLDYGAGESVPRPDLDRYGS